MIAYNGPRKFSTPPTADELAQLVEELAELYRAVASGSPLKLKPTKIQFGSGNLAFGEATRVEPGATSVVWRLPTPDSRRAGEATAIIVLSTSGTVDIQPTGGAQLDGTATATTLSANRGMRVFFWDGANWHGLRGT